MARLLLGATCVAVLAFFAFQVVPAVMHVARAATVDVELSTSDLLESCGYERDGMPSHRPYTEECVETIRELIGVSSTRGNIVALQDANAFGRVCVAELLDRPEAELVDTVAGWAARDARVIGHMMPAEITVNAKLIRKFRC